MQRYYLVSCKSEKEQEEMFEKIAESSTEKGKNSIFNLMEGSRVM